MFTLNPPVNTNQTVESSYSNNHLLSRQSPSGQCRDQPSVRAQSSRVDPESQLKKGWASDMFPPLLSPSHITCSPRLSSADVAAVLSPAKALGSCDEGWPWQQAVSLCGIVTPVCRITSLFSPHCWTDCFVVVFFFLQEGWNTAVLEIKSPNAGIEDSVDFDVDLKRHEEAVRTGTMNG